MCADDVLEIGEEYEIARGVIIGRRCVLKTLAVLMTATGTPLGTMARGLGQLTFEQFLAEVVPVAKRLVADTSVDGQAAYLKAVASFAVRLADLSQPKMGDSGQGVGPGTFIGFHPGGEPFTVLHWRMEPNTQIRTHAHTYGNVVTLGLSGEALVVNYEIDGGPDYQATGGFLARRTMKQRLRAGDTNLVNLGRNYIHGTRTGRSGARGLDITTRIRGKEPTPYLVLKDESAPVSDASWAFDKA